MTHTPGPWSIEPHHGHDDFLVVTAEGTRIIVVDSVLRAGDARLISAAPDMLEALEKIVRIIERPDPWDRNAVRAWEIASIEAKAAIAKAKGVT